MGVPTAITRQVAVSRLRPSLGPIGCRRGGIIRAVIGLGKTNRAVSAARELAGPRKKAPALSAGHRGTESSNPFPSSKESVANLTFEAHPLMTVGSFGDQTTRWSSGSPAARRPAARTGRGTLTRTASAAASNGQSPYSYAWSVDSGVFVVHGRDTQKPLNLCCPRSMRRGGGKTVCHRYRRAWSECKRIYCYRL